MRQYSCKIRQNAENPPILLEKHGPAFRYTLYIYIYVCLCQIEAIRGSQGTSLVTAQTFAMCATFGWRAWQASRQRALDSKHQDPELGCCELRMQVPPVVGSYKLQAPNFATCLHLNPITKQKKRTGVCIASGSCWFQQSKYPQTCVVFMLWNVFSRLWLRQKLFEKSFCTWRRQGKLDLK